jgi:iron complex transport system permease protein
MLFWLTGDLNNANYPWLGLSLLVLSLSVTWLCASGFNLLLRGEQEASALGLPVQRYKVLLFCFSALLTASAVAMAGCLGFIGLIVPHLTRRLVGVNHRYLVPAAALIGASLLMVADALARTCLGPQQLPVGILLTLLGVPCFIWMINVWRH